MHTLFHMTFLPSRSNFLEFFLLLLLLNTFCLENSSSFGWSCWLLCEQIRREQGQNSGPSCTDSTYFCFAVTVYMRVSTQRTRIKIWVQHTARCTACLVSLAYAAFYLPAMSLKSNVFTGFRPFSLHSPAGRLKLVYRIIPNVITIATYATLVPYVWKIVTYLDFFFFNKVWWNFATCQN